MTVTGEEMEVELPSNAKVGDLIEFLKRNFIDKAIEKELEVVFKYFTSQNLILVNNKEISSLKDVNTELKDGDVIKIVNFTRGGKAC